MEFGDENQDAFLQTSSPEMELTISIDDNQVGSDPDQEDMEVVELRRKKKRERMRVRKEEEMKIDLEDQMAVIGDYQADSGNEVDKKITELLEKVKQKFEPLNIKLTHLEKIVSDLVNADEHQATVNVHCAKILLKFNIAIFVAFAAKHNVNLHIMKKDDTELMVLLSVTAAVNGCVSCLISMRNQEKIAMASSQRVKERYALVSTISGKIGFASTAVGLISPLCLYLPGEFTWIPILIVIATICLLFY